MNEFELIRRYFTHPARGAALGVGDDAAILRPARGMELVVTTDMLLEGRHFLPDADARLLGHKSLAVNLSDIAAMGATPRWATLALALPRVQPRWLAAFARGFLTLARKFRVDLVGGDTTRGPLAICVEVIGEVPRGQALRRDRAKMGDDIWVSGEVGSAAAALAGMQGVLKIPLRERRALEQRLHAPAPRVALGMALRRIAHSAIDISDGLVADLGHICERSGVAAVVQWEAVPSLPFVRAQAQQHDAAVQAILAGGDDYELLFTAPPARRAQVLRASERAGIEVARIGRIERATRGEPLVQVLDSIGKPLKLRLRGYDHFG